MKTMDKPNQETTRPVEGAQKAPSGRARQPLRSKLLREALDAPHAGDVIAHTHATAVALVRDALRERASDIHLDPSLSGYLLRLRIDGCLVDTLLLDHETGTRLVRSFKSHAGMDAAFTFLPQDGRVDFDLDDRKTPMRASVAPTVLGEKLALRFLLPTLKRFRLDELGMSAAHCDLTREVIADSRGMILVSGPTGAGKTTTLYSLLREIQHRNESIVTIEDPVEDLIDGTVQIEVNPKQGLGFAEGVKGLLRLDPDVIMMGELRDASSAHCAIDAADSGRLFLATLHARDTVGTISMLRHYGVADHAIAATLDLVVAERLARRLCAACRKEGEPTEAETRWLELRGFPAPRRTWRATGCPECGMTGYFGRIGIFELWRLNEEQGHALLKHTDELTLRRLLRREGIPSMLDDMLAKVAAGLTSLAEAKALGGFAYSTNPDPAMLVPAPPPR
jgi:type II secretory ATPase GspE/PulE/Tfp pilus assembly ATPase PilB-like protein